MYGFTDNNISSNEIKTYGFIRFATASPKIKVGNISYNSKEIIRLIKEANLNSVSLLLFPELIITGNTCGDLLLSDDFINAAKNSLIYILKETKKLDIVIIIGLPMLFNNFLYNVAAFVYKGEIIGIVPNTNMNNLSKYFSYIYNFDEVTFNNNEKIPFGVNLIFNNPNNSLRLKINFDNEITPYINPYNNANLVCNLVNLPYTLDNYEKYFESIKIKSSIEKNCQMFSSNGFGESTVSSVYSGSCAIFENGETIFSIESNLENEIIYGDIDISFLESIKKNSAYIEENKIINFYQNDKNFKLNRDIKQNPFIKNDDRYFERMLKIVSIGVATRIASINNCPSVIGISGGIDSTLSLLITIEAYKILGLNSDKIICVTMSGFGTSENSYNNATSLINSLNITHKNIDIKELSKSVFNLIGHNEKDYNIVFENVQARERTLILMSIANQIGGIVIGTGDMSEIALGWSTYNGDHMSMYNPIGNIPKTLVKEFVLWLSNTKYSNIKNILTNINSAYSSPELKPVNIEKQKSEDIVGSYDLNDFFIYYFIKYGFSKEKILFLAKNAFENKYSSEKIESTFKLFCKRFFSSQWKRETSPPSPEVFSFGLSPKKYSIPSENFLD